MNEDSSMTIINNTSSSVNKRFTSVKNYQRIFFVLIFAAIGSYIILSSYAAANQIASLPISQMTPLPSGASIINDSSVSGGKAVKMAAKGTLNGTINFPSSPSSMTLVAKSTASYCYRSSPTVRISIDGHQVLSAQISSSKWTSYSSNLSGISPGNNTISINTGNSSAWCPPTLYLNVINFFGAPPVTPAPTIAISASPTTITAGKSSTITWTTTNATSCTGSGSWSGKEPVSGNISTGALNSNANYILICSGINGSATASAAVSVTSTSPVTGTGGSGSTVSSGGGTSTNSGPGNNCSIISNWVPTSSSFTPLSDSLAATHVCSVAENRPNNTSANNFVPSASALQSFYSADTSNAGQTVVQANPYDKYVTGKYTGTTDEIIQWASWKWGVPTDWLRAEYALESNWNQGETNSSGTGLLGFGFGDQNSVSAAWYAQYPKQSQLGNNEVFQSLGITQVKWAPDGSVGAGTEPLRWESTAFNVDYQAATIRFYFDNPDGARSAWGDSSYTSGQEWNSLGGWFSPYPWNNSGQENYITAVQCRLTNKTWTAPTIQSSTGGSQFEDPGNC